MANESKVTVRHANPDDWPAIADIHDAAFGGTSESALIAAIEQTGRPVISLLALAGSVAVGHVFFSPVHVQCAGSSISTLALAPMAVSPRLQRQGIGSQLVRSGLRACIEQACALVVVVGHPHFYPRFGFRPAAAMGLVSPYSAAGDAFMALELVPGLLGGGAGVVEYPEEFAGV